MRRSIAPRVVLLLSVLLAGDGALAPAQDITVVDVIPNNESNESDQNSEPSIAVNPQNTNQVVISAFNNTVTNTPPGGQPYYVSQNPLLWTHNVAQDIAHTDTTVAWSKGGTFYASPLTQGQGQIGIQTSSNPLNGQAFAVNNASLFTNPATAGGFDQPRIAVDNILGKLDHIYIGFDDTRVNAAPATVRLSLDGGTTWSNQALDRNIPAAGRDGPAVAVAPAAIGTQVYAAFERFTNQPNGTQDATAQIMVVRDNLGGTDNFADLVGKDGKIGSSALGYDVNNKPITVTVPFNSTALGNERLGSDLSIAVSPTNPDKLYLAFAQVQGGQSTIHVEVSTDSGQTWTQTKFAPAGGLAAGLPSLSVAANGEIGLLYASLTGGADPHLQVHFDTSLNDFKSTSDLTLADFSNSLLNGAPFQPTLGDYFGLEAIGNTFYGTFSAWNAPLLSDFPDATRVYYQRSFEDAMGDFHNNGGYLPGGDNSLLPIATNDSVDPFFFAAQAVPEPSTIVMMIVGIAAVAWPLCRRRSGESRSLVAGT